MKEGSKGWREDISKMSYNQKGLSNTRLYRIHKAMRQRCYKKYDKFYDGYGGRGIRVCDEWLGENGFLNFYNWSIEHGYDESLSIERKDVNGNYCPENCCWIPMKEQQRNKTSNVWIERNGERFLLADVAKLTGLTPHAIKQRIEKGVDVFAEKYKWNKFVERDDGKVYKSIREAAKDTGVHESKVGEVCRGKRKTAGKHGFRFLTESEAERALKQMGE